VADGSFRAATRIKYAVDEDGNPTYDQRKAVDVAFFEPGDVVQGLSREDMAQLWDGGSLYEEGDLATASRVLEVPVEELQSAQTEQDATIPPGPEKPGPEDAVTPQKNASTQVAEGKVDKKK
jgi:hypothetical protein